MIGIVRVAMEEGAWGLSSGPFYTPGFYSETDEIVALAKVAAEFGGAHQSHVRDESDYTIGVVAGLEEVIEVSRQAGLPGIHTHIKVLGPPVWGFSQALIHRIDRARAEGVEIYADQYPYLASATGLTAALLPRWSQVGGRDSLMARFDEPATMASIREVMVENLARRGGAGAIQFRRFPEDPSIEGKRLDALAEERGLSAIDMAIALFRQGSPRIVSFNMHPDDVRNFMAQPWTMTSSDGSLVPWQEGVPHPRSYGAFSRKLARYVRDEGVVELPFAIRSMTSLPAQVFRIPDRGFLQEGKVADIAVFDPARVQDLATFTEPHQLSRGMSYVFVNGQAAVWEGEFTGVLAGRVVQKR
jgi:N-acyl-D-aspartate/D-glutamate deacylase